MIKIEKYNIIYMRRKNMKEITVSLTKDEAEVVSTYLLRKSMRLEESGLADSYCYPRLYGAYLKISKKLEEKE